MDTKVMIGIGVALAAGVGIYLYTKRGTSAAGTGIDNPSSKPTPSVNAYAPPASTPDKSGGTKVVDFANKQVAAEAECFKQFPDRESAGYIFCLASKGISQL